MSRGLVIALSAVVAAGLAAAAAYALTQAGLMYVGSILLVAAFGGPLVLLLPRPAVVSAWVEHACKALPSLVAGLFVSAFAILTSNGRLLEPGPFLVVLAWGSLVAISITRRRQDVHLPTLLLAVLLAILPFTRTFIIIAAMIVQAAVVVALSGVRVPLRALVGGALAAASVFAAGLAVAILIYGSVFPPSLSLDADGMSRIIVPLLGVAAASFLGVLGWMTSRERRAVS